MPVKKNYKPKRRMTRKSGGVSKKVKQYVKAATRTPGRLIVKDQTVLEKLTSTAQIFYMDQFMNWSSNFYDKLGVLKVQSLGLKLKYVIHNNSTTIPVVVRLLVLECLGGGDYTNYKSTIIDSNLASASTQLFERGIDGSNLDNDIAFAAGSAGNIVRRINKEQYKVHRDLTLNLGTSPSDRANYTQGSIWIPFKRMITWNAPDSAILEPLNTKLVVLALPVEVPFDTSDQLVEITANAAWFFRA